MSPMLTLCEASRLCFKEEKGNSEKYLRKKYCPEKIFKKRLLRVHTIFIFKKQYLFKYIACICIVT